MAWEEEGNGSAAHRESNEREGEAGDALWAANRATVAVGVEDEDGVEDGVAGLPAGRVSVGRKGGSRRSVLARRRGEGSAVAAAIGIGGDGGVSVVLRNRAEETEGSRESERGSRGCVALV